MLKGSIITVLSSEEKDAINIASMLGKRDRTEERVYYRKIGNMVRSILIPGIDSILEVARSLSISSSFYLSMSRFTWIEGELALLAEAANVPGVVLTSDVEMFMKFFKELGISRFVSTEFKEFDVDVVDRGLIFVDRVFNVRGVGVVALGYALTRVAVHDKFIAYPMNREVEVRSIQVLDDDQEEVMPGTRVGLALRNVRLEDVEDMQALVKPGTKFADSINNFTKFRWSDDAREVHVIFNGIKVMGRLENGEVRLSKELPLVNGRALVINVNAKPRRPRIMGYVDISA